MDSDTTQTVALYKLIDWAVKNRQKIYFGVGAIIVVVAALAIVNARATSRETAANKELFGLQSLMGPTGGKTLPDPAGYLKVAADYPGTGAGERADLLASGLLFGSGKYAESQKQFEKFTTDYPESAFKAQAVFGIASALEAQGKATDAVAKYVEVTRTFSTDPVADPARLALARIYEVQNKPEEALKLYDIVTKPGAMSVWSSEAGGRREILLQRNPKLAAAITPVVTSSNAAPIKLP